MAFDDIVLRLNH